MCELLTEKDKKYRTVLLLGTVTDTQDITGKVLEKNDVSSFSEAEVIGIIQGFVGAYDQIPPMYSALKVNGKKLYELAREGKTIERKARRVQIYDIQIIRIELPRVEMEVSCSKGTYIRTLCHDIGRKLGCGGCMESLVRTQSGFFVIEDSHKLAVLQKKMESGGLEELLVPIDTVFSTYRKIQAGKEQESRLKNGNPFYLPHEKMKLMDQEYVRVYDMADHFTAIYKYMQEDNRFHAVKMFL